MNLRTSDIEGTFFCIIHGYQGTHLSAMQRNLCHDNVLKISLASCGIRLKQRFSLKIWTAPLNEKVDKKMKHPSTQVLISTSAHHSKTTRTSRVAMLDPLVSVGLAQYQKNSHKSQIVAKFPRSSQMEIKRNTTHFMINAIFRGCGRKYIVSHATIIPTLNKPPHDC